jgi:DNA-binding transcriptional ArsR family regulator
VTPIEHVPNTAQSRSKDAKGANIEAPALDRGLAILEALDARPEGLSLSEISRTIGSPKNSVSRLVQTLMVRGYVERDEATMIIRLTGKLLRLGHPREPCGMCAGADADAAGQGRGDGAAWHSDWR